MRTWRAPAVSAASDYLSFTNFIAFLYSNRFPFQMRYVRIQTFAVVNNYGISPVLRQINFADFVVWDSVHNANYFAFQRRCDRRVKAIEIFRLAPFPTEKTSALVGYFKIPRILPTVFMRILAVKRLSYNPRTKKRKLGK